MEEEYCYGKRKYDKKGAVSARNKRFKEARVSLRCYHCDKCNYWHLTKVKKERYTEDWDLL